jgi:RNA polymerase sigma factor (sigma-70 family)
VVAFLRRQKITPPGASDAAGVPDAVFVAQAQRDPRAFAPLYVRYLDEISRFCQARLRDNERARDATQQTFALALMGLPTYQEQGQFRGWLYAIARNVLANEVRRVRPQEPLEEMTGLSTAEGLPEVITIAALSQQALLAAIDRLPADQREAIELRIAGLTGVQIAAAMGRTHDSVRMLQRRAIDRLRRELATPPVTTEGRDDA